MLMLMFSEDIVDIVDISIRGSIFNGSKPQFLSPRANFHLLVDQEVCKDSKCT